MRRHLLLCSAAAILAGCGTAELHRIQRVEPMPSKSPPSTEAPKGGVWLARFVEQPDAYGGDRALEGIEILFCPGVEGKVSHCRVGVAWSRRYHPMTVRPRTAAEAPTPAPAQAPPPAAATAPPQAPASAAPPAAQPPADAPPPPGTLP